MPQIDIVNVICFLCAISVFYNIFNSTCIFKIKYWTFVNTEGMQLHHMKYGQIGLSSPKIIS